MKTTFTVRRLMLAIGLFAAFERDQADYHLYWRNRFLASALTPTTTLPVTSQDHPRRRTLAQLRAEGVGAPQTILDQ